MKLEDREKAAAPPEAENTAEAAARTETPPGDHAPEEAPSDSALPGGKPSGTQREPILQRLRRHSSMIRRMAVAAVIAALYVVLTLPLANIAFGIIQFRLAEVLTVLPAFSLGAVPGVFLGCLIANAFNPSNLGLVDILGGSCATLLAASLSYLVAIPYRHLLRKKQTEDPDTLKLLHFRSWLWRILVLLPPVIVNALSVGIYLPYLLLEHTPSQLEVLGSAAAIFLSQTVVIYGIGLPVMIGLEKIRLPFDKL